MRGISWGRRCSDRDSLTMPSSALPLVSMFLILQRWAVKGLTLGE